MNNKMHKLHPGDIVRDTINKRSELLERFAEVYLGSIYQKTGKMPKIEDLELVEVREGTTTRWYFRERVY